MSKFTAQTLLEKPAVFCSLIDRLRTVPDPRSDQGKRFELAFLLGIVLLGFLKGKTSIEACVSFARCRQRWFSRWFELTHGIPDPTTIGRALAVTDTEAIIATVNRFTNSVDGVVVEAGVSIDGKTVKAISELRTGIRHFISLFSHTTCRILDQEGVARKENEITATPRLLDRHCLVGSMVTADALLTQRQITQAITNAGADYLLVVKDNHRDLQAILAPTFSDPLTQKMTAVFSQSRKTRCVETVITTTSDLDLDDLDRHGWRGLALVGKLQRHGSRTSKRSKEIINETIYFITSRETLTPKEAYQFLRNHWHIENKLHWQKDVTWKEDRSRAKTGYTASTLSYFRSVSVQCIRSKYTSVTQAIEQFNERPTTYLNMLTQLNLV